MTPYAKWLSKYLSKDRMKQNKVKKITMKKIIKRPDTPAEKPKTPKLWGSVALARTLFSRSISERKFRPAMTKGVSSRTLDLRQTSLAK